MNDLVQFQPAFNGVNTLLAVSTNIETEQITNRNLKLKGKVTAPLKKSKTANLQKERIVSPGSSPRAAGVPPHGIHHTAAADRVRLGSDEISPTSPAC
jgi:hypothetical protein